MTYQHEYDRDRLTDPRDFRTLDKQSSGAGKWILVAFIAVVLALGIATLIPPAQTANEAQVGTIVPAPKTGTE